MRATKTMQSYRLDSLTICYIDGLAESHGISKAEVVAKAVELLAKWDNSDPIGHLKALHDTEPTWEPMTEHEQGRQEGQQIGLNFALSALEHLDPRL